MKLGFETSQETEEIIKLRVQLARNRSKITKFQQLTPMLSQINELSSKTIEQFSINNTILCDLGKQLDLNFTPYQPTKTTIALENKDALPELFSKQGQLLKMVEKENVILKQLGVRIQKVVHENHLIQKKNKQIQTKHSKYESLVFSSQGQAQNMKKLLAQLALKQLQLKQVSKSKQQLNQQLINTKANLELFQEKIKQFQSELLDKTAQLERIMCRLSQEQTLATDKQRILEKCSKLINSLELSNDQYLSNYFKSNGLPLEVHRPLKNKYQMVFE